MKTYFYSTLISAVALMSTSAHAIVAAAHAKDFSAAAALCSEGAGCGVTFSIDGTQVGTISVSVDAKTGNIITNEGAGTFWLNDEQTVGISGVSMGGNVDPTLIWAFSAINTSSIARSFSAAFNAPLVPNWTAGQVIQAYGDVAYTLTAPNGGTINAVNFSDDIEGASAAVDDKTFGEYTVVNYFDLTTTGAPVDKGVDVGFTFSKAAGGSVTSPVYSDTATFVAPATLTTMSAVVAFSLTPNTSAGLSGMLVQSVPEPESYALVVSGLAVVGAMAARRRNNRA
jgi:hypothetical protein